MPPGPASSTWRKMRSLSAAAKVRRRGRSPSSGEAAGGDRRGKQSAAMVMITTEDFPDLNLRVDDHPEPLTELARLLAIWRVEGVPRLGVAPSKANPSGMTDLDAIEAGWIARGMDLRLRR